jgi:cytochrome c biogenesis protein CcmG/thiol:disulfide interchange protein DsbE
MIGRLLPVLLFVLLGGLLAFGLKIADRKSDLPSPLVGREMPKFTLPLLGEEDVIIDSDELIGEPMLINFWASWCVTCRLEHPVITDLAESGAIRVIGLHFRDETDDALAWLRQFGNPYTMNIQDLSGRTSIDFGVYAAPESFLVDDKGVIVFKQLGAMTPEVIETEILPRIRRKES